jgi:hypothetical protein
MGTRGYSRSPSALDAVYTACRAYSCMLAVAVPAQDCNSRTALAWLGSQLAVTMGFEVKCVPPMPQGSTEVGLSVSPHPSVE